MGATYLGVGENVKVFLPTGNEPEDLVTGKFTDFPVCVIRNIFIRKLSHLTISSPFISINQKMHKTHSSF